MLVILSANTKHGRLNRHVGCEREGPGHHTSLHYIGQVYDHFSQWTYDDTSSAEQ